MTRSDQHAYLTRRARQERDIAICCEDNAVALTHFRFADEYEITALHIAGDMCDLHLLEPKEIVGIYRTYWSILDRDDPSRIVRTDHTPAGTRA